MGQRGDGDAALANIDVAMGALFCRVVCRVSCRVVSCRVVSCRVVSRRVVSCRVVSCRVVSCRVVSCRVVSYHNPSCVAFALRAAATTRATRR